MSESFPLWEQEFFAEITLESAEAHLKDAQHEHEASAANYFNSIGLGKAKVESARKRLRRAADRLHWAQQSRDTVAAAHNRLHQVTTAQ